MQDEVIVQRLIIVPITGIWSLLLRAKFLHLIDRSDFFKISNLVYYGRETKFAGSNPAEAVGFLGRKKSSARLPSEGK